MWYSWRSLALSAVVFGSLVAPGSATMAPSGFAPPRGAVAPAPPVLSPGGWCASDPVQPQDGVNADPAC